MNNKINRPNRRNNENGFTLIEMIAVIAILGIIMAASFVSLGASREKLSMDQAQASLLSALEEAQNRSATGFGASASSYGVRIVSDGIYPLVKTVVGGVPEITAGDKIALPTGILTDQTNTDIIFNRLKSTIDSEVSIKIKQNTVEKETIIVKTNGKISTQ